MFKIFLFWIFSLPIFVFAQNHSSKELRWSKVSIEFPSVTAALKTFHEARLFYPENDSISSNSMYQEKMERLYYRLQRGELNTSTSSQKQNDLLYKSQYDFLNGYFSSGKLNWKTNEDGKAWMKAIFDLGASMYIYSIK